MDASAAELEALARWNRSAKHDPERLRGATARSRGNEVAILRGKAFPRYQDRA